MRQTVQGEQVLRVLMVTPEFPPLCGGIGWYVYYLSRELTARGHFVTIALRTSQLNGQPCAAFEIQPVKAGIVPLLNAFRMVASIREFIKANPMDLAIVHSTPVGAWLKNVPTILLSHSVFAEARKGIYRGARDLNSMLHVLFSGLYIETERRSIQGADVVSVVSHAMKDEVHRHYGKDAVYVGNAVDIHRFQPAADQHSRGVLLPSLLRPGKGIPETVQVMRILRERGCDIPFRFINKGAMKKVLVSGIEKLGISNVEWIEPVDHSKLPEIYQNSSIVFLPSAYEGLPNVCLEAMACGLPMVATDVGGTKEAVIQGRTGYIHSLADVTGMAESISRLDSNARLRSEFGHNGKAVVSEHYTWGRVGDRWQELIEGLV